LVSKEFIIVKKLVSVIVPAYNEEECVDELVSRLQSVFGALRNYNFELIFVENGSHDSTWNLIKSHAEVDSRIKLIRLSRNFRLDGGLTAGLEYASGDACILMTADLQDPPEMIEEFIAKWELGWENVYGVVVARPGTGPIRRLNSTLFYKLANKLTDGRLPENASDFRLIDRKVCDAIRSMNERNRFVRGLIAWTGFKSIGIPVARAERFAGKSNADTLKVLELAIKGILAHSFKPLRFITSFGLICSILAILAFIICFSIWMTKGVPFSGFGSIISAILVFIGLNTFMLGIISEYISLIYEESKSRPNYIVSESFNL
jgi:polyisoprenyl-phosphate glycosyltransferase